MIRHVTDGAVHTLLSGEDGHTHSAWNASNGRPVEDCYTNLLMDAFLNETAGGSIGGASAVVLGLGAGVIPARLASLGVATRVLELYQEVVDLYRKTFEPMLQAWSSNVSSHVSIVVEDVLTAPSTSFGEPGDWVFVDIPACYRDASALCMRLIKRLVAWRRNLVVNVWFNKVYAFRMRYKEGKWFSGDGYVTAWVYSHCV